MTVEYSDDPHDLRMAVALNDIANLDEKDKSYGSSWKKRGGVGAFMMLARKWDRIETLIREERNAPEIGGHANRYDIFDHIELNYGGILDDVRDLRRYLLLVESELLGRGKLILDEPKETTS